MDWTSFMNPFGGFGGAMGSVLGQPGLMSPGLMQDMPGQPPDWSNVPLPTPDAMIGGQVNPVAPGEPLATDVSGAKAAGGDTDKMSQIQRALRGIQAPAAPQVQRIQSPNAQPLRPVQASQVAALLASMGVSPSQLARRQRG